jgi:uncharacterized protein (TIGR02270 family)
VNLVIPEIISSHVEEAGSLFERRGALLEGAQIRLKDIQRTFEDRIAAHLDALAVADEHAWQFCEASLDEPSPGAVCTAAVRALEDSRPDRLDKLFALSGAIPETRIGLIWALGWVARDRLQGLGARLIDSQDPLKRAIGMAACSMHRVDPRLVSGGWLTDVDTSVRARALRLVGEVGSEEAVPVCLAALNDSDPECRFWAAWSAVLLGNRGRALEVVRDVSLTAGPRRARAFQIALQAMKGAAAHELLRLLAEDRKETRRVIQGSGIAGDPKYVPWLIRRMADPKTSRSAGEAVALITGCDLKGMRLDGLPPIEAESGPNDDPEDPNVETDPDDDLPWPDQQKIEQWWSANGSRFHEGTRYFMGAPVTREHCIDVLKNGYQRQRVLAAHYLCLLDPGTPLFNTNAPCWRQQRLLAAM